MAENDEGIDEDTKRLRAQLDAQEAAYIAWSKGESHPDDELYARIWRGESPGVDADKALDRINRDRKVLAALGNGTLLFSDIPGWRALGNSQQTVTESLQQRCAMYEEALRSGGRNLSVNQGHVRRSRENENPS